MEKLIELLNKHLFEKGEKIVIKNYYNNDWLKDVGGEFRGVNLKDKKYGIDFIRGREVISKGYGFIKWLVENNKINLEKLLNIQNEYFRLQVGNDNYNSENYFVDGLLMLLAIQDEPIDFLIEILK